MKHIFILSLATLALSVLPVRAQAPTGMFVYPGLGAGNQAIWDVSGTYEAGGDIGDDEDSVELLFPMTIVQDGKGKISGSGTTDQVKLDGNLMTGTYSVKGTFSRSGANATLSLSVSLAGTGLIEGSLRSYKISINYTLQVNPTTRRLVGIGGGSATAQGLGKAPVSADVDVALPNGMNGTWSMTLDQQASGTKLGGSATILLSNSRRLTFSSKGKYTPATQTSALKLTGTGGASGAKLDLVATGEAMARSSLTGSALGNTVQ